MICYVEKNMPFPWNVPCLDILLIMSSCSKFGAFDKWGRT